MVVDTSDTRKTLLCRLGQIPEVAENLRRLPIVPTIDLRNFSVGTNERGHQRVHNLAAVRPVFQAKEFGYFANLLGRAGSKFPVVEGSRVARDVQRISPQNRKVCHTPGRC